IAARRNMQERQDRRRFCEASKLDQNAFQDARRCICRQRVITRTIPGCARDRENCAANCKLCFDKDYIGSEGAAADETRLDAVVTLGQRGSSGAPKMLGWTYSGPSSRNTHRDRLITTSRSCGRCCLDLGAQKIFASSQEGAAGFNN